MSVFRVGSNKSSVNNFPSVRPTLDLDFANSKTLDPRITFTRASGGSYVGADGLIKYAGVNEARFDHDPVTGESLGLLVEESRQNIVLNSITLSSHTNNATTDTVTTETTSPDGTLNAYKVIGFSGVTTRQALSSNSFTMNANSSYTASVFLKGTATRRYVVMWFDSTRAGNAPVEGPFYGSSIFIDLLMGTSTNSSAVKMVPYGNGWYRCSITATVGASNLTAVTFKVSIGSPNGFDDIGNQSIYKYVGDGTSGIYYWGPQLEVGAFATSYIPTIGSTRTRAADNASMTGTNFTSWYNSTAATGGTISVQARRGYSGNFSGYPNLYEISDGTNNNRILLNGSDASIQITPYAFITGGVLQIDYVFTNISTTNLFKTIHAFSTNSSTLCFNGSLKTTDTSVTLPSVNRLFIGCVNGFGNLWNGTIARLTYYPKRLPNAQLQALTK